MIRLFGNILLASILILLVLLVGCSPQNKVSSTTSQNQVSSKPISGEITTYPQYRVNIPSPAEDVPAVTFELIAPLPDVPDKMQVYRMIKPEVNIEYAKTIGAKLNLSGGASLSPTENVYHMSNQKDILLDVYPATGAFSYSTGKLYSKAIYDAGKLPVLPSFDKAAILATDFLNQRGWLSEDVKVDEVIIGGKVGNIPDHLAVSFDYRIDGFRVTGPGDKYSVRIADQGEIGQLMINPVKYSPHDIVTIKGVDQAFQELQTNKKYAAPINTQKIKIDSVSTEYWLEPMNKGQEFIVPVFTFKGQCLDSTNKVINDRFIAWVEAIK
jgi:hypothetical protein